MVKSLVELKRELAFERKKSERETVKAQLKAERRKLRFDLAKIRNPGFFKAGRVITAGARSAARGIRNQAILIKQQQERENAEARKLRMESLKSNARVKKAIRKSTVIKKRKPIRKKTRTRKKRR